MHDLTIIPIDRLKINYAAYDWPLARSHRGEIDAHFDKLCSGGLKIWNGRMLLMKDHAIESGELRGTFFAADYAEFLYWRDHDFPDRAVINCFSMGALRSEDGAFLLGVMGDHTANAGKIYFPAGTPEPDDVRADTVDLCGNILREIAEETGLGVNDIKLDRSWCTIMAGDRLPLIKPVTAEGDAGTLRRRMLAYLAREQRPELSDIRIVRTPDDFDTRMPDFILAYLSHALGAR